MAVPSVDYDYLLKILLIGRPGVGKRSILHRFCHEQAFEEYIPHRIGIDFLIRTLTIQGREFKFQVWDSPRHDRFPGLRRAYFRATAAVLLVYDVHLPETFEYLLLELRRMREFSPPGMLHVVLGNKCDAAVPSTDAWERTRGVPAHAGQALADSLNGLFFETSARDYLTLVPVFERIGEQVLARQLYEINPYMLPRTDPRHPSNQPRQDRIHPVDPGLRQRLWNACVLQ
eukprot:m.95496 g.95496  ORF g.95496 m.95496 type:complete len:230 (+) comp51292_c0_seq1:230-919(+)